MDTRPRRSADTAELKRRLRRALVALVILIVVAGAGLAAAPGLRGVDRRLGEIGAGWIVLAVAFKLLSGHGYVLSCAAVFARAPLKFTERRPWFHFVARIGWLEQGFQAVIPVGGAGAPLPGALVLRTRGMSWGWIAERSTVLFLLTSAVNVAVFALCGLALALGILPGPTNVILGLVPAAVGVTVLGLFLALPLGLDRLLVRLSRERLDARILRGLSDSVIDVRRIVCARDWRLIGPVAYLVFDVAVLWVCFRAFGQHRPPVAALVLGYQIGYLSDVIPVPGAVGVLDGGLIGALVLYGADVTAAAAAVLVYHAIVLAVPLAVGFVALLLLPRTTARPTVPRPAAPLSRASPRTEGCDERRSQHDRATG
jgi:uncharacterized membrane protein YbhN (UPF0104 family)